VSNKSDVLLETEGTGKDFVKRRRRNLAQQPDWTISDLLIALGLASLVIPAWVLPESWWAPLWRAAARIPFLTSRRAVKQTAKSIRTALGDVDRRRAEDIAQDLKACVYEMRLQDLRAWRPGGWRPRMRLEGEEHLLKALGGGKGAILWLAPFVFNSGPTKIIIHERGHKVSHLSSVRHGFSETRFGVRVLNRIRCVPEDRYLEQRIVFDRNAPSTAMRRMMRALKAGEVVSIVAASTEGSEFVKGPVFGGRLPVAVGAPRLAGSTGAPLLPAFTVRDPKLGFRIVIEAPIALDAGRPADETCAAATAEFLRRSEPWVRHYPEQWRAWSKWRPADK
jgi:lauroyl/myristoyl acyltransferase